MATKTKQSKKQGDLRSTASSLWSDQQALLDRANGLARDRFPQAHDFATNTVVPAARTVYADRVQPAAQRGAVAGKAAGAFVGSTAKDAAQGVLIPAATSAATAALALLNEGGQRIGIAGERNEAARKALTAATRSGEKSQQRARVKIKGAAKAGRGAAKAGTAAAKVGAARAAAKTAGRDSRGIGAGGVVAIVLGALALGGIAYAVWQTLRADDDLWVADEDPEITPTSDAPTA